VSSAGQERRQALVEAAFHRLGEKGFEGLRLREVAADVGVDHSTIHHYFATKQDLIEAVVGFVTRQFWSSTPTVGTPADRLRGHLDVLAQRIVDEPGLHAVLRELDLRATRDPAIRAVVADHEHGWRRSLADVFSEGILSGAWAPELSVDAAVELVIAAAKGASLGPESSAEVLGLLRVLMTGPPVSRANEICPGAVGEPAR